MNCVNTKKEKLASALGKNVDSRTQHFEMYNECSTIDDGGVELMCGSDQSLSLANPKGPHLRQPRLPSCLRTST
jgi:hypothetical protein